MCDNVLNVKMGVFRVVRLHFEQTVSVWSIAALSFRTLAVWYYALRNTSEKYLVITTIQDHKTSLRSTATSSQHCVIISCVTKKTGSQPKAENMQMHLATAPPLTAKTERRRIDGRLSKPLAGIWSIATLKDVLGKDLCTLGSCENYLLDRNSRVSLYRTHSE